jgi:hypothetical protein
VIEKHSKIGAFVENLKDTKKVMIDFKKKIDNERRRLGSLKIENPLESLSDKYHSFSTKNSPSRKSIKKTSSPLNISEIML